MAERIASMEEEMKQNIKTHVEKNEFMKDVEARLMKAIKENSIQESKLRQKETVEKCVDDALNQLVKKRYGNTKDEVVNEE